MKKYTLFILLFVSLNSFGQQYLWTTNPNGLFPNSDMKVIPKNQVLEKLETYFQTYDYYYDFTGFTKDGFFKEFEGSSTYKTSSVVNKNKWVLFKKSVREIKETTIICIKSNDGNGSSISILVVNKNNFDSFRFSNRGMLFGSISTYNGRNEDEKNRFIKFYRSLIED